MKTKVYTDPGLNPDDTGIRYKPLYNAYEVAWRTKWEMDIIKLSAKVRSKPNWIEKLEDETTVQEWVGQLKQRPGMTKEHIDYFVAELRYYAKLQRANDGSGAKLSGVDMVWTMTIDDSDTLAHDFRHHVDSKFKNPTDSEDRPTSDDPNSARTDPGPKHTTYCAIYPSYYSLVYGKTSILERPAKSPIDALDPPSFGSIPESFYAWKQAICELNQRMVGDSSFIPINEKYLEYCSRMRHWLPADIHVNDDGSVAFKSYINDLHPGTYPETYTTIARIIARCLPVLEQVLTDWKHPRDLRIPYDPEACVREPDPLQDDSSPTDSSDFDYSYIRSNEHRRFMERRKYDKSLVFTVPTPGPFSEPSRPLIPHSLRNKDLQVVVALDDFHLYPRTGYYYRGEWHGDGTAPEQIVASIIYFYHVDTTANVSLSFREGISQDENETHLNYERGIRLFDQRASYLSFTYEQQVGSVEIKQGLVVCYPNVYQHMIRCDPPRDSSGIPKDSSSPFVMKTLTIYLVDPSVRIVSTSVVPPQQKKWWVDEVSKTPLMKSLPWFVRDQIIANVDMPMSSDEAWDIGIRLDEDSDEYNNPPFIPYENDRDHDNYRANNRSRFKVRIFDCRDY